MSEHQQEQGVGPVSYPPLGLIQCPFCGGTEQTGLTVGPAPALWGVLCYECGCFLDCRADSADEAVALWNRRTDPRPNHAYRVGVAVGRAFIERHAHPVLDGEEDREGYWREQAEVYRLRAEALQTLAGLGQEWDAAPSVPPTPEDPAHE